MKILDLVQGSPEWKAARTQCFTASEASIMMACSKHVSRNELLRMKATGTEQEFSDWFEKHILDKGHQVEALARPIAEEIIGAPLYPVTGVSDDGQLLSSFDGLTMLEDICWECKQLNAEKVTDIQRGIMPEADKWQVIQQLVVSGADRCLYMVTDGTKENTYTLWVDLEEGNEAELRTGWNQFAEDQANYTPVQKSAEVVGEQQAALPALVVELTGQVTSSNLPAFKETVLARINAVSTELSSDQDFADAEATVKFFDKGEKQLKAVKQQALDQTATIADLFKTIDDLTDAMRTKRLALNKLVKEKKEQIRTNIILFAKEALANHISQLEAAMNGYRLPSMNADFAGAIKGKKTVNSIKSAADDELARVKIAATNEAEAIQCNIAMIEELASDHLHLFPDSHSLVHYGASHLEAEITARIAKHEAAEKQRKETERAQIRAEEQQRAQVDLASKPAVADTVSPPTKAASYDHQATDTISIPIAEYEQLKQDSNLLAALQRAGVDSWDGYSAAIQQLKLAA